MQWGFWLDSIERVARTVIQAAGAAVLATWIEAGSWSGIDWSVIWQVALYAGGLAVLMAVASKPVNDSNSPSLLKPEDL